MRNIGPKIEERRSGKERKREQRIRLSLRKEKAGFFLPLYLFRCGKALAT